MPYAGERPFLLPKVLMVFGGYCTVSMPYAGERPFLLDLVKKNRYSVGECQCPMRANDHFYGLDGNNTFTEDAACQCPMRANDHFYEQLRIGIL